MRREASGFAAVQRTVAKVGSRERARAPEFAATVRRNVRESQDSAALLTRSTSRANSLRLRPRDHASAALGTLSRPLLVALPRHGYATTRQRQAAGRASNQAGCVARTSAQVRVCGAGAIAALTDPDSDASSCTRRSASSRYEACRARSRYPRSFTASAARLSSCVDGQTAVLIFADRQRGLAALSVASLRSRLRVGSRLSDAAA